MKEEPLTTPPDTHDSLTGLLSRTAILKKMEVVISRRGPEEKRCKCVIMDDRPVSLISGSLIGRKCINAQE